MDDTRHMEKLIGVGEDLLNRQVHRTDCSSGTAVCMNNV
jgi:hypothetical protein